MRAGADYCRATGKTCDTPKVDVWRFQDGRAVEFTSDSREWSLWASLVLAWLNSGSP